VRFVQRQPGSGTRLLTDYLLQSHGIAAAHLTGATSVEDSHMAVAAAVASGLGDAGLGLAAAAQAFGLDFVPVMDEDYFLVCLKDALDHPAVLKLRQVLAGADWTASLASLPGYRAAQGGEVLSLVRALPWWAFRHAKDGALPADAASGAG
jgi:putative molybdopterin biosynthesis protein